MSRNLSAGQLDNLAKLQLALNIMRTRLPTAFPEQYMWKLIMSSKGIWILRNVSTGIVRVLQNIIKGHLGT